MSRRRFLAGAAALLAGCVHANDVGDGADGVGGDGGVDGDEGFDDGDGEAGVSREVSPEEEEEVLEPRAPGVVDLDSRLEVVGYQHRGEDGVRTSVNVTEGYSGDSPARMDCLVVNRGGETVDVPLEDVPPYAGVAESEGSEGSVHVVPAEDHELLSESLDLYFDEGVWRSREPPSEALERLPDSVTLPPDEGFLGVYHVVSGETPPSEGVYSLQEVDDVEEPLQLVTWYADSPGPTRGSRFEDRELPSEIHREAGGREFSWRVDYFHDADRDSRVYVEADRELVEPSADVEFSMVNRRGEAVDEGEALWGVAKQVDGGWLDVRAPWMTVPGGTTVYPGERHTEGFHLVSDPGSVDEDFVYRHPEGIGSDVAVGGGTYVYYRWDIGAAAFDVDAPDLSVEPPEDAEVVYDGERAVVTAEAWRDAGDGERSEFAVARMKEDVEEAPRVISEQLYGLESRLRYALPYFDGDVEEVKVRVHGDVVEVENPYSPLEGVLHGDVDRSEAVFRYEGESYRLEDRG